MSLIQIWMFFCSTTFPHSFFLCSFFLSFSGTITVCGFVMLWTSLWGCVSVCLNKSLRLCLFLLLLLSKNVSNFLIHLVSSVFLCIQTHYWSPTFVLFKSEFPALCSYNFHIIVNIGMFFSISLLIFSIWQGIVLMPLF